MVLVDSYCNKTLPKSRRQTVTNLLMLRQSLGPIDRNPRLPEVALISYLTKLNFRKDNLYSSETTLNKFYAVNAIPGNGLSYDWCKNDLTALFHQKDEYIVIGTTIYLFPRT